MTNRQRLSATVDPDLLEAGRQAVADGRADNLSAWVNAALRRQADHDRRMAAIDDFIAAYEAEHGEITGAEMEEATRRSRSRAVVVRSAPGAKPVGSPRRARRGAA